MESLSASFFLGPPSESGYAPGTSPPGQRVEKCETVGGTTVGGTSVEGEHVRRVLDGVWGNKAKAARVLGISKPRLYRLIEKHQLV